MQSAQNRFRTIVFGVVLLLLASTTVGCSSKSTVKGEVLLKSKPLSQAEVIFELKSDPVENRYTGGSFKTGNYVIDTRGKGGIPPGDYKVIVKWWVLRDGKPLPGGEEGQSLKYDRSRSFEFNVVFEKTVEAGENIIDLPVEKGKRVAVPVEE